jgi:hypothetical protein
MTKSREVYEKAKENGIIDKREYIKFKGTGEHFVTFKDDKIIDGKNFRTGKPEEKMKYTFEEDGEEKFYETAIFKFVEDKETGEEKKVLSNFVESMSNFDYGDKLKMEYKPIPGTPRGFIDIQEEDDDIPVYDE